MNSTSQPEFAGHCMQCGGLLYVGLVHGCQTGNSNARVTFTTTRFQGDQPTFFPDKDIPESDQNKYVHAA